MPPIDLRDYAARHLGERLYWLREDGRALLFICGGRPGFHGKEQDPVVEPTYEYCDEDVRLRLYGDALRNIRITGIHRPRIVSTSRFFERANVLPDALFRPSLSPHAPPHFALPRERLWRRLRAAADGMLRHKGRPSGSRTHGVFVAGVHEIHSEQLLWIDDGR